MLSLSTKDGKKDTITKLIPKPSMPDTCSPLFAQAHLKPRNLGHIWWMRHLWQTPKTLNLKWKTNMKRLLILSIVTFASSAVFANPVLPKAFFGNWAPASTPEECNIPDGYPIDFPESGLQINKKGISQYEEGCTVKKIFDKSKTSVTANFSCGGPDGSETVKMTLSLSADGKYLLGFDPYKSGKADKFIRCK